MARRENRFTRWRIGTLVGVHVLFIIHFMHWKLKGRTLAPLEFNEALYTLHQGIVTAGFLFLILVMLGTLVFGRFFCGWACHIHALQETAGWIMDKLRIKRQPVRSRTLMWIPMGVMFYLFIWPQILQLWQGAGPPEIQVVEAGGSRWSSYTTDDMWRNLPGPGVAMTTFFICGFVMVYLLGSRGFCFQACPYGALFSIADQVAPGRIVLTKDCSQCGLCTKACTSDILVHRELAEHGMVTNPKCLKDLDCVAACPDDAVKFGFRKPPLFRKGHPMGSYSGRFTNTMGEDIFLAGAFLVGMPVYRSLYERVPFLLAVALAACTAWLLLLGWRMIRRGAVQFRSLTLKMDGELRPAGRAFAAAIALVLAFFGHSAWVQTHTLLGKLGHHRVALQQADAEGIRSAIGHYEAALRFGLFEPVDRRFELASLYQIAGDAGRSRELLEGIVEEDPGHAEARFRLGEDAMRRGDRARAMQCWEEVLAHGKDRSGTRSREILARAAMALGAAYEQAASLDAAQAAYAKGLERVPDDPGLLAASGAVAHRTGRNADAIRFFEQALQHGGPEEMLRNNLGALLLEQGRLQEAMPHFKRLVALKPSDVRLRYMLGALHARQGQRQQAQEQWQAAARLDPDDPRVQQALASLQQPPSSNHP